MPCPRQRKVSSSSSSVSRGSATHSHTSVAVLNFFRSFRLPKPSSRDLYASWSETSFSLASFSSRAYSSSVTRFIPAKFGIGYRDSFTAAYSRLLGPRVWSFLTGTTASELPGSGLGRDPGLAGSRSGMASSSSSESGSSCAAWPFLFFPLTGFFRPSRGASVDAAAELFPPPTPPAAPEGDASASARSRSTRAFSSASRCMRVCISCIARVTALSTGSMMQSSTLTSASVRSLRSSSVSSSLSSDVSSSIAADALFAKSAILIGTWIVSSGTGGGTLRAKVSVR